MKWNVALLVLAAAFIAGCDTSTNQAKYDTLPLEIEQKEALSYMWHEESLAYDLYLALYAFHDSNASIAPLSMIATKSESTHTALVEELVEKYDINVTNLVDYTIEYSADELAALPAGTYVIPEIQDLYDELYAKGTATEVDAIEAGCMVEVVDVMDLNNYINVSSNYPDLVSTFEALRADSYKHYWKFNDTLVDTFGVVDGCCSLGTIKGVNYCKTEDQFPR